MFISISVLYGALAKVPDVSCSRPGIERGAVASAQDEAIFVSVLVGLGPEALPPRMLVM